MFGQEVIDRVRQRFGIDLIVRAHQVSQYTVASFVKNVFLILRWFLMDMSFSTTMQVRDWSRYLQRLIIVASELTINFN